MKKMKNWAGILALVLLIVQSTIGIINYAQSDIQHGFPNGMNVGGRNESMGFPPQVNNLDPNNAPDSSSTNEDASDPEYNNGQRPSFNKNFENQQGSFTVILRNIENGLPGLIINCLSLGLAIVWFILSILTKRQEKSATSSDIV